MIIIIVDTLREVTLIKESTSADTDGLEIKYFTSLRNAREEILRAAPDIILIGSGIINTEGFEVVRDLREIPIVILAETDHFLHLIKDPPENVYSFMRAFDLEEIPLMFQRAVGFCSIHKEKLRCT